MAANRFIELGHALMNEFEDCDTPEKAFIKAGLSSDEINELADSFEIFYAHFQECMALDEKEGVPEEAVEPEAFMKTMTWAVLFGMKVERERRRLLVGLN